MEEIVAPISLQGKRVFVERELLEGKRVDESLLFLGEDSVGGFQCGVYLWEWWRAERWSARVSSPEDSVIRRASVYLSLCDEIDCVGEKVCWQQSTVSWHGRQVNSHLSVTDPNLQQSDEFLISIPCFDLLNCHMVLIALWLWGALYFIVVK
ncbi:Peptide/nitrate transporter protein [Corchorus olitorius]|uniref:Peptide/nitrate transporter protein n=1 Tax=Corchorus olitorius TaxID=93759 RepID=A0A1R3L0E0_9ROSI|nr:Peptide/nitrate transporter protein [Corchorus olitorius]